jgi:hypothetical protein
MILSEILVLDGTVAESGREPEFRSKIFWVLFPFWAITLDRKENVNQRCASLYVISWIGL